jgi:hypothetical protein
MKSMAYYMANGELKRHPIDVLFKERIKGVDYLPRTVTIEVNRDFRELDKFDPRKDWEAWVAPKGNNPTILEITCELFAGLIYIDSRLIKSNFNDLKSAIDWDNQVNFKVTKNRYKSGSWVMPMQWIEITNP